MVSNTTTPAVALVCHHHVGLGIMRSLGRLGVESYAVEADSTSPALASKYCRDKFILISIARRQMNRSNSWLASAPGLVLVLCPSRPATRR